MAAPAGTSAAPLLVYDGDCAFCSRSVQFILRHDRTHRTLEFAARGGVAGAAVRQRHPELATVDSMIWVDRAAGGERTAVRADAVLAIARYLGGVWGVLAALGRLVPRPLRDAAYGVIARHRRRLAAGGEACVVFTAEERSRALD